MPVLHLVRQTTAPPSVVWSVLADFAAYSAWMPLTRMSLDAGDPHPGWGFAGVSGIGPLSFRDSMLVTAWEPPEDGLPARFRVIKTGRLLGGWAQAQVLPDPQGSRVVWDQDLTVAVVPPVAPLEVAVRRTGEWLYGRAIDAMLVDAERRAKGATQ
jgi:hypothetical protein